MPLITLQRGMLHPDIARKAFDASGRSSSSRNRSGVSQTDDVLDVPDGSEPEIVGTVGPALEIVSALYC